jgi:hypothetical protein
MQQGLPRLSQSMRAGALAGGLQKRIGYLHEALPTEVDADYQD